MMQEENFIQKEDPVEENNEIKNDESGNKEEGKEKSHKSKGKKDPKLEQAEEEVAKLNDKYLRLYSEFDNYRKRTLKEKIELSKNAATEVIYSLLPVLDDFERAISAIESASNDPKALKDGVILIYSKLLNLLNQQGLEPMKTIGEPFDTDFHEAITNIAATSPEQQGKVLDEVSKGYLLNGKVIRYAKVVVGS
ncbi:MAG: nucleotide exchange factor GrpE [Bacteroidetes bacterium]|nr:nucleotide exchange factor GrpE [Bacteroidota bacterium]